MGHLSNLLGHDRTRKSFYEIVGLAPGAQYETQFDLSWDLVNIHESDNKMPRVHIFFFFFVFLFALLATHS